MTGPTAWQQQFTVTNTGTQSITTTSETVIATLNGVNSRVVGVSIYLTGSAVFAVQAATTSVTLRIRQNSLTGTAIATAIVSGGVAGDITAADGTVAGQDNQAGEYAGMTYVLTIQAAGAGANWNVVNAVLNALC